MRPLRSVVTPDHSAEGDSFTQFRVLRPVPVRFVQRHQHIAVRDPDLVSKWFRKAARSKQGWRD